MARRRNKNGDFLEALLKLGGLLILLGVITPQGRQVVTALGTITIVMLIALMVVGLVSAVAYKIFKQEGKQERGVESAEIGNPFRSSSTPVIEVPTTTFTPVNFIEKLRAIDWYQFEKLVALLYENQGYSVTRRGGANPDGGIDLIIEKDGSRAAIQCKQWKTWNVGVKAVREFLGALTDQNIERGIFITLNGYSGDAKQLAEKHHIEIINEIGLMEMLSRFDIQQDPRALEILNDSRKFCPKCERQMVIRVAVKGPNPGERFWGCTGYPKCRFRMPMP